VIDTKTLNDMIETKPECELGYTGVCEGTAAERGYHPTGEALGEDGWEDVWYCFPCAWEAARDS
jgi:hypothetical protein